MLPTVNQLGFLESYYAVGSTPQSALLVALAEKNTRASYCDLAYGLFKLKKKENHQLKNKLTFYCFYQTFRMKNFGRLLVRSNPFSIKGKNQLFVFQFTNSISFFFLLIIFLVCYTSDSSLKTASTPGPWTCSGSFSMNCIKPYENLLCRSWLNSYGNL